jgi:hypothetical protein
MPCCDGLLQECMQWPKLRSESDSGCRPPRSEGRPASMDRRPPWLEERPAAWPPTVHPERPPSCEELENDAARLRRVRELGAWRMGLNIGTVNRYIEPSLANLGPEGPDSFVGNS